MPKQTTYGQDILALLIAERLKLPVPAVREVLDAAAQTTLMWLNQGVRVEVLGSGNGFLNMVQQPPMHRRSIQTGELYKVPARSVIKFLPVPKPRGK